MVGSVVFNRLLLVPLAMGALYLFGGRGQLLLALVLLDLLLALLTLASLYGVKLMGPFARLECEQHPPFSRLFSLFLLVLTRWFGWACRHHKFRTNEMLVVLEDGTRAWVDKKGKGEAAVPQQSSVGTQGAD